MEHPGPVLVLAHVEGGDMMDFRGKRSTLRMWALGAGSAVVWACGLSARAAPLVFWASEPVQPDDTVILLGDALGPAATVEISRLPDVKTTGPGGPEDPVGHAGDWQAVTPLVSSEQSLHVVVPATWKQGAFVLRVRTPPFRKTSRARS